MKTQITLADILFDIYDKPIGISASGGADSSLLLYILMKYGSAPIHVFTCASKEKNRVAPHIVSNVIAHCIDSLDFKHPVYHHVYFVEIQTFNSLFNGLITVNDSINLSIIYTAVTANPPSEELAKFKNNNNGLSSKRDHRVIREMYHPLMKSTQLYTPMFNVDKTKIKEIYDLLGITDTLFPITRSCESLVLKSGHCDECWWCEERSWAFGRLE